MPATWLDNLQIARKTISHVKDHVEDISNLLGEIGLEKLSIRLFGLSKSLDAALTALDEGIGQAVDEHVKAANASSDAMLKGILDGVISNTKSIKEMMGKKKL